MSLDLVIMMKMWRKIIRVEIVKVVFTETRSTLLQQLPVNDMKDNADTLVVTFVLILRFHGMEIVYKKIVM